MRLVVVMLACTIACLGVAWVMLYAHFAWTDAPPRLLFGPEPTTFQLVRYFAFVAGPPALIWCSVLTMELVRLRRGRRAKRRGFEVQPAASIETADARG